MLKSIKRPVSITTDILLGKGSISRFFISFNQCIQSNLSKRSADSQIISRNTTILKSIKGNTLSTTCTSLERSNYSPSFYYDMNSKHIGKGSQCPPLQEGKLRIYSMRFCPYAQRAILVALAKGIPHDVVNCQLKEKPEWLLEKNPNGKVPVLDGKILYESLVVSEYLDMTYKNRSLRASNPFEKALDRIWIEEFNKIISLFYKSLFAMQAGDDEALQTRINDLLNVIARFEKELSRRGTSFFGGDDLPGMLDYMIWPWVERMPAFRSFLPEHLFQVKKMKKENPKLEAWRKTMKEDFAVKEFFLPPTIHQEFIRGFLDKNLNYDILEAKPKL